MQFAVSLSKLLMHVKHGCPTVVNFISIESESIISPIMLHFLPSLWIPIYIILSMSWDNFLKI